MQLCLALKGIADLTLQECSGPSWNADMLLHVMETSTGDVVVAV